MEPFVSEKETKKTIGNTFISISFTLLGMILAGLLYWSYVVTDKLYIAIFTGLVLGYSIMMVVFISLIRTKLTEREFKTYMSVSLFISVLSLILFIVFVYRSVMYFRRAANLSHSGVYKRGVMQPQANISPNLLQYNYPSRDYINPVQVNPLVQRPMNSLV